LSSRLNLGSTFKINHVSVAIYLRRGCIASRVFEIMGGTIRCRGRNRLGDSAFYGNRRVLRTNRTRNIERAETLRIDQIGVGPRENEQPAYCRVIASRGQHQGGVSLAISCVKIVTPRNMDSNSIFNASDDRASKQRTETF